MVRKSALTGIGVGAMVVLAACGGGSDGSEATGSIDASVEEGFGASDEVPSEPEAASDLFGVTVFVELPAEAIGNAIVVVEDVTLADGEASELGRVQIPVSELAAQEGKVDFELPVPFSNGIELNAAVHIDADGDGTVSTGDWVSPDLVLLTPFTGSAVNVAVVQV